METWDRGIWEADGDPAEALAKGELKFRLSGTRLNGGFVLVRLKPRPKDRTENWLLIKEHDAAEERGADATMLEHERPPPAPRKSERSEEQSRQESEPPAQSAVPGELPTEQSPQLATLADDPPEEGDWLSELKFDGYRLLAFKEGSTVRLLTRNGHDWTARLPTIARAVARLDVKSALLDGELVALREDGVSSFALLQQALSDGVDKRLLFYVFDLLHLNGWDLRGSALRDRKQALAALSDWQGTLRYSDHFEGQTAAMRRQACGMGLEGIICKQADAPYRAGRSKAWLKVKCKGREEFIVLGFTPPAGSRTGIGALHVGYRDPEGNLQYVGGVGTGFSERELAALRRRLDKLAADPPERMVYAGERPDTSIVWVRPELVVEVQFVGWSGSGRIRHATYLGLREDKSAAEVVRPVADPEAKRIDHTVRRRSAIVRASAPRKPAKTSKPRAETASSTTVVAKRPERGGDILEGVKLTNAERELWPGVTKRDFAEYLDRDCGPCAARDRWPPARVGPLPRRDRGRALFPEARQARFSGADPRGPGRQRSLSGAG